MLTRAKQLQAKIYVRFNDLCNQTSINPNLNKPIPWARLYKVDNMLTRIDALIRRERKRLEACAFFKQQAS
jgi:hypothetical protein